MTDSVFYALALVLGAGACQGSFMLPTKWINGWVWENYWLIFSSTAYLICPWILALATIPGLFDVYARVSMGSLVSVAIYGTGWGFGALTFGLGVEALGLALGFAIILGVAATAGTLVPLLVQPPQGFSLAQGAMTAVSLAVMIAGVAICSLSGRWKETESGAAKPYRRGLGIAIASGLLSSCGNLGFAFGSEITQRAEQLGVSATVAPNALWTLLAFPLFLCNATYSFWLLRKNGSSCKLFPKWSWAQLDSGSLDGNSLDVWFRTLRGRRSHARASRPFTGMGHVDVIDGAGSKRFRTADRRVGRCAAAVKAAALPGNPRAPCRDRGARLYQSLAVTDMVFPSFP